MSKRKRVEEAMTVETPTMSRNYGELFQKIESLSGLEKKNFCKGLTLEEKKSYIQYLREKDCEKVRGVFRCFEPIGGTVTMTVMAYDGETPTKYDFTDGQEYEVPKYVAKRFESEFQGIGTWYPTHSHILDQFGRPTVGVGKKNRRFGFSSMEFQ